MFVTTALSSFFKWWQAWRWAHWAWSEFEPEALSLSCSICAALLPASPTTSLVWCVISLWDFHMKPHSRQGPGCSCHICCLCLLSCVLSVQNGCSHSPAWGQVGAVYAALIVSSLDLQKVHFLVSATGWAEDCASLVFDLCLCAEGRGCSFYTTFALVPEGKVRCGSDWVALDKLPNHPELWDFWGISMRWPGTGLDDVWCRVGTHWPVLIAASDVIFLLFAWPVPVCPPSWSFPITLFRILLLKGSLLPLLCDNFIPPLSHLSKMRPSFDIRNRCWIHGNIFAELLCPDQARAEFCRVWGSMESWDGELSEAGCSGTGWLAAMDMWLSEWDSYWLLDFQRPDGCKTVTDQLGPTSHEFCGYLFLS